MDPQHSKMSTAAFSLNYKKQQLKETCTHNNALHCATGLHN